MRHSVILLAPALMLEPLASQPQPKAVSVPTIIIHGTQDEVVPLQPVRAIAQRLFTNLNYLVVDDGHRLQKAVHELDWKSIRAQAEFCKCVEVEMLTLINAILGGVLLVAGRKLFWLFVAAAGFITGFQLTTRYLQGSEGLSIIVGLVVGAIFAILAIFLQTIAIGIAGFLAGGYILQTLATMLGFDSGPLMWVIYIVGGIIGVLLVSFLFDWAIITLSSLAGAALVVEAFQLQSNGLIFLILVLAGVIIQGITLQNEARRGALEG